MTKRLAIALESFFAVFLKPHVSLCNILAVKGEVDQALSELLFFFQAINFGPWGS